MLNPSTPLGYAELLVRHRIDQARGRSVERPRDLGASVIEWVIISAIVVAIAIAVGATLSNLITKKASAITLDGGTP
jgi:hypothetical protein